MRVPVVFLSYSHDSDEHREKILELAERLRQDGLDARLDQYVNGTPVQGWPRWMLDQLDEADFVLVVCTETYYRRFRGHEEPGRGKGAAWEGALITQEIYDSRSRTVRFVPLMLASGQERFVPEPLRPHTHYELTSEERYEALYAFLLGEAGFKPRQLGKTKPVSKRSAKPTTFGPAPASLLATPTMIGVPHRNPFFAGRQELLSRLHQQIQTQGISALAQAAIHGLGGIGKTQTAIEYVYRFGEHYRCVLWVVAENETSIRAAYLSIARELGIVDATVDLETALLAVKAWLSHEEGWLLVFDNADDPGLVRPHLPPVRTTGKVLLTSRAKSLVKVGVREPLRVETLEPEDAVKFLLERTGNAEAETAAELAAELGYLPLALEQAAAYIETIGCSFAEYLAKYRRQGVALVEKGKPSTDYPWTVATTWSLSFASIREASSAAAELLTAAAFLLPESVPIEIFTLGGWMFGKAPRRRKALWPILLDFFFLRDHQLEVGDALSKGLAASAADELGFWELLEPLERYSLVERLPNEAFKLHRLTQEVVKDSLGEEGRRTWAERVVRALNAAYPLPYFENWKLCEKLQPSVVLASDLARKYKQESAEVGRLFNNAGAFAGAQGDYANAKLFAELSLEISVHVLGSEHPSTLISTGNLAETLSNLGDFSGAKQLHEQTLKIQERVLGPEHPDTLATRNNLATTLYYLGDLAGSRKLLDKQTLETFKRVHGAEHPATLMAMNNLAETLRSPGDLTGTRKLHEQILAMREGMLGREHPDTLQSRNNLAVTLAGLGDHVGAKRLLEQNLEIMERVLGTEHPTTTIHTWNLLLVAHRLNDPDAEAQLIDKLRWLLDHDEDSIPSADQRNIRHYLLDFVNPSLP